MSKICKFWDNIFVKFGPLKKYAHQWYMGRIAVEWPIITMSIKVIESLQQEQHTVGMATTSALLFVLSFH